MATIDLYGPIPAFPLGSSQGDLANLSHHTYKELLILLKLYTNSYLKYAKQHLFQP